MSDCWRVQPSGVEGAMTCKLPFWSFEVRKRHLVEWHITHLCNPSYVSSKLFILLFFLFPPTPLSPPPFLFLFHFVRQQHGRTFFLSLFTLTACSNIYVSAIFSSRDLNYVQFLFLQVIFHIHLIFGVRPAS